jgi:uncharacterized protein YcfJ
MLKRTLMISCVGLLLASQNAQAGDAAQNGALGGAAGGAILGQAIGRNTEGTLLGTAIGGVLGYMIGNEMDKDQTQTVRTVRTYSPPPRMERYEDDYEDRVVHYRRPVVVYERPVVYCPPQRVVIIDRDEPPRWGHRWHHEREHDRGRWRSGRYDRDRD